ncbi:BnaC07g17110D [Brassica napus]|uniref:BnaC07g17110D protein n=1 Tax=Brassica napus TaxID=3708 RepID=A0A078J019_BRANA|nr:BnaC07g17110D [Brassica napus]
MTRNLRADSLDKEARCSEKQSSSSIIIGEAFFENQFVEPEQRRAAR